MHTIQNEIVLHAEMQLVSFGLVICVAGAFAFTVILLLKKWRAWVAESPEAQAIFVAVRNIVMRGQERIAVAASGNMAKRIANALNAYQADSRGQ